MVPTTPREASCNPLPTLMRVPQGKSGALQHQGTHVQVASASLSQSTMIYSAKDRGKKTASASILLVCSGLQQPPLQRQRQLPVVPQQRRSPFLLNELQRCTERATTRPSSSLRATALQQPRNQSRILCCGSKRQLCSSRALSSSAAAVKPAGFRHADTTSATTRNIKFSSAGSASGYQTSLGLALPQI